ncbi:MAG: molecular chaperone DnaJ [Candidatus Eisenbacteria bacterium]|uniref:Chaperone protein DnaJ n=1 Tax=Eiseniibacteriota bacterium TaxID=2212470 RepID=A0A956LXZ6_UNCEI|nr:molecular chaperone DnaJ [Candidatus Eisenbacteria bacterium]
MAKRDYYEVLEIERSASVDEIKSAYRKLALQYHPDRNAGDKTAEERFKELGEAYEVLKDPQKRQAYDQFGHAGVDPSAGAGAYGGMGFDLSDALRAFMRDFGGFGDMFGAEGGMGGRRPDRRGGDRQIRLELTLREVASGAKKKVRVRKFVRCGTCAGAGTTSQSGSDTCTTCGGSGQIRRVQRSFFGQMVNVTVCGTCRGEGSIVRDPCTTCGGDGRVEGNETVEVSIPAGVMEGNYMTLRGLGDAGVRNGAAGDLIVIFVEKPDSVFERHGEDVLCDLPIHPHQAVLGDKVEVPTLDGKARVEIPPGIQSGKILRLRGKGIPSLRDKTPGDQLIRVVVVIPTKLSAEQKTLYESLAQATGDKPPKFAKGFFEKVRDAFTGS